jgi:regulator of protease activity HflC (stomatin/prohibitin superfamily)
VLDRLIDIALQLINDIVPFVVIPHYDRGVRLRLGIPKGKLEPGFHWKIPFVDEIITHMIKVKTLNLSEQTLTTKDGQSVVIKVAIKYDVEDVETLLLEVNDPIDALSDMVSGITRAKVTTRLWSECNDDSLIGEISRGAKVEAKKWGLRVLNVTITDLGLIRSIRLLTSK